MTRFPRLAVAAALALAVAACSDDDNASDTTVSSVEPAVTTAPATTATPEPSATEDTVAASVASGPVQIDVMVGVDSGPDRVEHVAVGAEITLNITNPNAADEFHVHGVELEQAVDRNVMATFNFTADTAGTFEVESHTTDDVLVVIEVS